MALYYNVLYNDVRGCLKISYEGCVLLQQHFPHLITLADRYKKYGWTDCPRDDQEVIQLMLNVGLTHFNGAHCILKVYQCPIYAGHRLPYLVSTWEGLESIEICINYKQIARDLAKGENSNPLTAIIRTKGFDVVDAEVILLESQLNI